MSKPSEPKVDLSDSVLIALRRIIQSIDLHSRYLAKNFGLTGPQLMILRELSGNAERTVGEIAKNVSLSQATDTGILERLEKRRLIKRRRSDTDRRCVLISGTDESTALLNSAPPLMQAAFLENFNQLQAWEQTMILSALQRLVTLTNAGELDVEPVLTTGSIFEEPNIRE